MTSIWDISFVVTDVETTGSDPKYDRITEIACFIVHGGEIISEYSTLINPHKQIPPYIVSMTGITQEMVNKAPNSKDISPHLDKLFNIKNAVFVAHNVRFDYSFVQNTLQRDGFTLDLPQLCTLKLARKVLPKDIKKNVGSLAHYFDINITHRHRAFGDAEATAYILLELLEKVSKEYNIETITDLLEFQNKPSQSFKICNEKFDFLINRIQNSPETSGIFYFFNDQNEILYIGMAKSIKDKLSSYFSDDAILSPKIIQLLELTSYIDWKETNSELAALILELNEIRKYNPLYNKKLRKFRSFPFLKINYDNTPYLEKTYNIDNNNKYYGPFTNRFLIDEIIEYLNNRFKLNNNSKKGLNSLIKQIENLLDGRDKTILNELKKDILEFIKCNDLEKANKYQEIYNELELIIKNKNEINNNVIIVKPNSFREKLIEIIFIRNGKLVFNTLIGRRSDINFLKEKIINYYFLVNENFNFDSIDELRIINSWMYKHKNIGNFVYIKNKTPEIILDEIKSSIECINFDILNFIM